MRIFAAACIGAMLMLAHPATAPPRLDAPDHQSLMMQQRPDTMMVRVASVLSLDEALRAAVFNDRSWMLAEASGVAWCDVGRVQEAVPKSGVMPFLTARNAKPYRPSRGEACADLRARFEDC